MSIELVIIGVAVGVFEIIFKPVQKKVTPIFTDWVEKRLRKNQKQVYENKVAISALFSLIQALPGVIKAVQIQTKNGGGIPRSGTPLYGSIISPAKYSEAFRSQLLDSQYCELVSHLITEKKLEGTTALLPNCVLKDLLDGQQVKHFVCYDVAITKNDYNFIKVDLEETYQDLTPKTRDAIRQYINELIIIIKS